jgi:hypothetical protein
MKALDDDDTAWNVVSRRPICGLTPSPERDVFIRPEVTMVFANGTGRVFNPDDQILIGPTIA